MLQQLGKKDLESLPVMIDASFLQIGKQMPAVVRMYLPTWKGHDEVFWQALGDYVILALHKVTDVKYSSCRGGITVYYFNKVTAVYSNTPEDIRKIIQGIAFRCFAHRLYQVQEYGGKGRQLRRNEQGKSRGIRSSS